MKGHDPGTAGIIIAAVYVHDSVEDIPIDWPTANGRIMIMIIIIIVIKIKIKNSGIDSEWPTAHARQSTCRRRWSKTSSRAPSSSSSAPSRQPEQQQQQHEQEQHHHHQQQQQPSYDVEPASPHRPALSPTRAPPPALTRASAASGREPALRPAPVHPREEHTRSTAS